MDYFRVLSKRILALYPGLNQTFAIRIMDNN